MNNSKHILSYLVKKASGNAIARINGIFFILILALSFIFIPCIGYGQAHVFKPSKLIIFYSPGCHNCIRIGKDVVHAMDMGDKNNIRIECRDVDNIENYKLLLALEEVYQPKIRNILPVFYYEGRFINGKGHVGENLERMLTGPAAPVSVAPKTLPKIDLVKLFNSFTLPAIIAVGLIDGINPCAITVILFFISFLRLYRYEKHEIAVIGLTFVFSVYLTYCLIGLGIFESFYKLQGFWLLSKIVNIVIGIISVVFGFYALYSFIRHKKETMDNPLLWLPKWVKNWIYKIIGYIYRLKTRSDDPALKKPIIRLVISALIAGFLVSVLEAVCVAKIYLPTIVFVLKTTGLKLKALTYLLFYNLLFIVPLLAILSFALAGTTVDKFQKILNGHLGLVKILMGLVFLGMGIFLICRA